MPLYFETLASIDDVPVSGPVDDAPPDSENSPSWVFVALKLNGNESRKNGPITGMHPNTGAATE